MATFFTLASATFAFIAAFFWAWSALVKTPQGFSIHVVKPKMGIPSNPIGGTYMGHGYSAELEALANALRRQSNLSKVAASNAAFAAIMQTIGAFS